MIKFLVNGKIYTSLAVRLRLVWEFEVPERVVLAALHRKPHTMMQYHIRTRALELGGRETHKGGMVTVGSPEVGRLSWGAVLDTARHFGVSPRTVVRYLQGKSSTARQFEAVRQWVARHYAVSPSPEEGGER